MNEKQFEVLARSNKAQLVLDNLKPTMDLQVASIINRMKIEYRGGQASFEKLLASVASLCAIEDLETDLRSAVSKGTKVREETMK